jgi:hypothetical protein
MNHEESMWSGQIAVPACTSWDQIKHIVTDPIEFASYCVLNDEQSGEQIRMKLTDTQRVAIYNYMVNDWTMIIKFRQAKMTSLFSRLMLLREVMFKPGYKGVLLANKRAVAIDQFRMLQITYNNLPPFLKVPLQYNKPNKKEFVFCHGASIEIMAMGDDSVGSGYGIDRLHITEAGESPQLQEALSSIIPAIIKRPHARVVNETTPGAMGGTLHDTWRDLVRNEAEWSRYSPLFLKFWKDDTCVLNTDKSFAIDDRYLEYKRLCPDLSEANYALMLQYNLEVRDWRVVRSKYPLFALDGWKGAGGPQLPNEPLELMFHESNESPDYNSAQHCAVFVKPVEGSKYWIFADPCGYQQAKGDPAALSVICQETREEVASWIGYEGPDDLATRASMIAAYYNNATVAVENNKDGMVAALKITGTTKMYWYRNPRRNTRPVPGWPASASSIRRGTLHFVTMLKNFSSTDPDVQCQALILRDRNGIKQCQAYDGNYKRRSKIEEQTHHWDKVRTYIMAADILRNFPVDGPVVEQLDGLSEDEANNKRHAEYERQLSSGFLPIEGLGFDDDEPTTNRGWGLDRRLM